MSTNIIIITIKKQQERCCFYSCCYCKHTSKRLITPLSLTLVLLLILTFLTSSTLSFLVVSSAASRYYSSAFVIHNNNNNKNNNNNNKNNKKINNFKKKRPSNLLLTSVSSSIPETTVDRNSNNSNNNYSLLALTPTRTSTNTRTTQTMLELKDVSKKQFRDKTILITGASGGLGSALARLLASCQPSIIVLSARRESVLQQVVTECKAIALASITPQTNTNNDNNDNDTISPTIPQFIVIPCDLEDPKSVDMLASKALDVCGGTINILINNGGVSSRGTFLDTSIEVDRRIMQINFFSGVALAKALVPKMIASTASTTTTTPDTTTTTSKPTPVPINGRIIWISSVQGLLAIPSRTSYGSSKFAVQGYCDSMRAELFSSGILVHTISPGYIRTGLSMAALTSDGTASGVMDTNAATGADPDDVAVEILDKVASGRLDFTVAATRSAIIAIYLRLLCPALLRNILVKRFAKEQQQQQQQQNPTTTTTGANTSSSSTDPKLKKVQ